MQAGVHITLDMESARYVQRKREEDSSWSISEEVREMLHEMMEEDPDFNTGGN